MIFLREHAFFRARFLKFREFSAFVRHVQCVVQFRRIFMSPNGIQRDEIQLLSLPTFVSNVSKV